MSNSLSPELLAQLMAQESGDPFLTLITLSHPSFSSNIRLVNNSVDITSNGSVFTAFPVKVRLPTDDGETAREFSLEMDNVSLEFIDELRSVTDPVSVKMELILASIPDQIQLSFEDLRLHGITYNRSKIIARLIMDDFLSTELSSERYTPSLFPGIF